MKVSFIISEEVHEKLLMLADEVGDTNQAVIRGIKELYEKVFEVNEEIPSLRCSKEKTEDTQEIKNAIERLEEKLTNIEIIKRAAAPQKTISRSAKVPEVEEIDEAESSVSKERPDLEGMLDDVVVNSGGGKVGNP